MVVLQEEPSSVKGVESEVSPVKEEGPDPEGAGSEGACGWSKTSLEVTCGGDVGGVRTRLKF